MSNELRVIEEKITHLEELLKVQKATRLTDSLFSPELAPHYSKLAQSLCQSNVVPKCYMGKPNDAFICMALGYQLGMSVEQSLQDIAVINGRPCVWGDGMLAICMRHAAFEDIIEEFTYEGDTVIAAHCTIKRKGMTKHEVSYSLNDARRAKLLSKPGAWQTDPARMLRMRARAFALRDRFADALRGLSSAEEVLYIDGEVVQESNEKITNRTQQLKDDYQNKTGQTYDNGMVEAVPTEESSNEDKEPQSKDTLRERKNAKNKTEQPTPSAVNEVEEVARITKKQLTEINEFFELLQFDEERIAGVIKYYECETLEDISKERGDHLINSLKQIRDKNVK